MKYNIKLNMSIMKKDTGYSKIAISCVFNSSLEHQIIHIIASTVL